MKLGWAIGAIATMLCAGGSLAATPLTAAQMDRIAAGADLTLTATAGGNSIDQSASGTSSTSTFTNGNVIVGHARAVGDGTTSFADTGAVVTGSTQYHVETHTNTTGSGMTHSQTNAVVH